MNDFQELIQVQCYSKSTIKSYEYHIKNFRRYYYNNLVQENILKHLFYLRSVRKYNPNYKQRFMDDCDGDGREIENEI